MWGWLAGCNADMMAIYDDACVKYLRYWLIMVMEKFDVGFEMNILALKEVEAV